jgi:hypothetical protein
MVLTIEPGLYFIESLLAPLRAAANSANTLPGIVSKR